MKPNHSPIWHVLMGLLAALFINSSHASKSPQLCQTVELKWGGWLPVATVSLYAPICTGLDDIQADQPMSLKFVFHRKISGDYFRKQANESFKANLSQLNDDEQTALENLATAFNANYVTIQPDDKYLIARTENRHLRLWKNDELMVQSEAMELSAHYFDIWLGQQPAIPKLKKMFEKALSVN